MTNNSGSYHLSRRGFLAAGGVTAAAVAAPQLARAATTRPQKGPTGTDWTALAKDLAGSLVRPGDASYNTAKRLSDPRFDTLKPAGIAYVKNARDIATCLAFVRKFGLEFAARCGGHSYAGWSSASGLIIDVQNLKTATVTGTTATFGSGVRLIDFYHALAAKGRSIPAGSCPTVGLSGLTLGGGVGVTARAYGLTSDNLESLEIVTADGKLRNASKTENPDLFWACRGGGGGNFGVVISFTFITHPAPQPVLFFLSWPWAQADKVIGAWQSWAPNAPDALWSNLHLAASPGGTTPTIQVGGCYLDGVSGANKLLAQLYARTGSHPSTYFLNQYSYLDAMLVEAGCSAEGYEACHLPWYAPGGQLTREPQYAKSDLFTKPLNSAGIGTLLAGVEALQKVDGAQGGVGGIAFDALGGAVNRVKPSSTAFVHRDALFMAQYTTDWAVGASKTGIARQYTWQQKFWQSMRGHASGQAYQNYIDPALKNWQQAYYGANYPALRKIKQKYDPARLFDFPQAI